MHLFWIVLFFFSFFYRYLFNFLTHQHCELADFDVEMLLSHVLLLLYVFPLSQVISIGLKRKKVNSDLPCSERLWDSDWFDVTYYYTFFIRSFLFTLFEARHLLSQVFLTEIILWYSYHRIIRVKKIRHPVAHKQGSGMAYLTPSAPSIKL